MIVSTKARNAGSSVLEEDTFLFVIQDVVHSSGESGKLEMHTPTVGVGRTL